MKIYSDEQEYAANISEHLAASKLPDNAVNSLLQGILQADEVLTEPTVATGLNLRFGKRILREKDLPVIEGISMAAAAITAVLVPAALAAPAIITGIAAFAKMAWTTWKKTAKLSEHEISILGLLNIHGPLNSNELVKKAKEAFPECSIETLSQSLASLTDVELLDGDVVELIRQDASGRWRVKSDV